MANFLSQYTGAQVEEAVRIALNISTVAKTGNYTDLANKPIYCESTAYWHSQPTFKGNKGDIIIYSDYRKNGDGKYVAGIKIADGLTDVIDLPFIIDILESELTSHINDTSIHVSKSEKEAWNEKVSVKMGDNDTLILY